MKLALTQNFHCATGVSGTARNLWDRFALYSPFGFALHETERKYNASRLSAVQPNARCLLCMTSLFWAVSLVQGLSAVLPSRRLALFAAWVSFGATLLTLAVQIWRPRLYERHWTAFHFAVHLAHIPTYFMLRTVLIQMYTPHELTPCRTWLQCVQEYIILVPHFAAGLVSSLGIALPLLLQIVMQATVLAASYPGNTWICTTSHHLSPLVVGVQDLLWHSFLPRSMVAAALPDEAVCPMRLAFWEIQAAMLAVVATLLQDLFLRRQFLAKHPDLDGETGDSSLAKRRFGSVHNLGYCIILFAWLILVDVLLVDSAMAWTSSRSGQTCSVP
jgi:hypothetical protein